MIRVLVAGAAGKVGSEVMHAVSQTDDMEVVAAVDPSITPTSTDSIPRFADLGEAIAQTAPQVMVDFTRPDVVESNLRIALTAGVDCVVGTTGLTQQKLEELASVATPGTCLFFAPNFAVGAVLMMQFAQRAARFMPHVEVIELHHDQKLDAPSGTAIRTARLIAAARSSVPIAPGTETELDGMDGARGASVEDVTIHSVRLPGLVAHQEVLFGGQGQTLSIRHDSIDRTSFMPGVLLAVKEVGQREGLVVGLEHLMGE